MTNLPAEYIKDLPNQIDKLIDKSNTILQIASRSADPDNNQLAQFFTFTEDKLAKIAANMPEINRATRAFGRRNTQTTNKLMTLTMLNGTSPYQVLKQCLAEIENRRSAVKENTFKLMENRVKLEQLQYQIIEMKLDEVEKECISENKATSINFNLQLKQIEIQKLASDISDSMLYIEGAFKDIASFQSAYIQIKKNNNIPDNWDEVDYENSEIKHHIRQAFFLLYRDILQTGAPNMATMEYLHQFGINPQTAYGLTRTFLQTCDQMIQEQKYPTFESLEVFFDEMADTFKDCYKDMMKRLGLDTLHESWYAYQENKEIK